MFNILFERIRREKRKEINHIGQDNWIKESKLIFLLFRQIMFNEWPQSPSVCDIHQKTQNTTNHRKFVTNNMTWHDPVMYHRLWLFSVIGLISIYIADNSMDCNYWKLLLVSRVETCREPISSDFNVYIAFQTSSKAVSSSAIS